MSAHVADEPVLHADDFAEPGPRREDAQALHHRTPDLAPRTARRPVPGHDHGTHPRAALSDF